jgi:hypothetical protein
MENDGYLRGHPYHHRGETRRHCAALFTDGLTWKERQSDLLKLVDLQNKGDITRIYPYGMAEQFEKDLRQLKTEAGL